MSNPSRVSISNVRPDVALLTLEAGDDGRVRLDDTMLDQIDQAMERLASQTGLAGVIVRSGGRLAFAQPWDIEGQQQRFDWDDQQIVRYSQRGRAVLARLSRCPFPTAALIECDCLGSALELTLWADYRLAVDGAVVGLPQVTVGLTPGWGGASLFPRIVGLEAATDLITSGRLIEVREAQDVELVDEVCSVETILDRALALIDRVGASGAFVHNRKMLTGPVPGITPETWQEIAEPVLQTFGKRIVTNEQVFAFAPTVVLEHLTRTCASPIKVAWQSESAALAQVWGTSANQGLSHYQSALQHNASQPGLVDLSLPAASIATVGIVGAGLMGGSIAKICFAAGLSVRLLDADGDLAAKVVAEIEASGRSNTASTGQVQLARDYDQLADCDLVIESVVETLDVKKIVLQRIESVVAEQAIIATNTSAIPIEKLAASLEHPARFCGIHFCHPELMALVEVVDGPATLPETICSAIRFVQGIKKIPIAMQDSPGFVVNRLLAALLNASLELFVGGVEIQQIDAAMRAFGFLGGPFEIIDVIGVDTCMYAGRTMWEAGVECVSLSPILPKLMKNKRLGRKSGAGFYEYPDGVQVWKPAVKELIDCYRTDCNGTETKSDLDETEIQNRILNAVAKEANLILDKKIVGSRYDIDLCIVNGFSFPKHRGGILFWHQAVTD